MVPSRILAFDYLTPISIGGGGIFVSFRQPPSYSIRDIVSSSLSLSVWITTLLISVNAVLLMKTIFLLRRRNIIELEDDERVLEEPVFWVLMTFCQRSNQVYVLEFKLV
jgi:hypothetical protein